MPNIVPYKKVGYEEFEVYHCDDDHILLIKRANYPDIDIYYVITEDAYRTPTAEVMTKEAIFSKYEIKM